MSASPARARRRRGCRRKQPDNGRAPKLLQKLGRVNHDSAFSRAREGSGHHDLASRASRRCRRRPTRARRIKLSISRPAVVWPDDHFRFRKFGSRRVMDSISRPAVVGWWSRASYGVSPTTPPIEPAPTIGHWGVLSLWHFRLARSGSSSGGWAPSGATNQAERQTDPHLRRPTTSPIPFSPNGSGRRGAGARRVVATTAEARC